MKKFVVFTLFLLGLSSVPAQSYVNHFAAKTGYNKNYSIQSSDSVKILAVLVDFQPDKYDGTVGNGKFGSVYTQDYGDTIVDPLPHNAQYFEDHLEFAKNYFRKVSNGKVNISYNVLPEVITVSKTMRAYVPGYQSTDLSSLGNFAEEVWSLADQKYTNVNFSDYNLFLIFHAGVSAGLNLGVFSIDRNIPSLYLSSKTLKNIFGEQFAGFPVENGTMHITNTMIMPETESRELEAVDGSIILQQITINGAIVSNIASHLGLPDLFNTETGMSAIGRFGLMDSQAIYANSGLFPPEPSPWEKMYLGWITPITVSNVDQHINIAAHLTAAPGDTTLLKIPINSSEYYLIENREQDALHDNLRITYKRDGQLFTKVIMPDTSGLFYALPDSIPGGVVVDVDEFDAAVPGNGIVIWHIDDNIINTKIGENKINSDLYKKGVDVVEADGTQDIGEQFSTFLGEVIGEGSYQDLWYRTNDSELYKNKFSYDTKPNSNSNDGAKSLITLDNFSSISNKMSFDLKYGQDLVKLVSTKKFDLSNPVNLSVPENSPGLLYLLDDKNVNLVNGYQGDTLSTFSNFSLLPIASINFNSTDYLLGSAGNTANIYVKNSNTEFISNNNIGLDISSPFVVSLDNNVLYGYAGTSDGSLVKINLTDIGNSPVSNGITISKIADDKILQICKPYNNNDSYYSAITVSSFIDANNNKIILPYQPLKSILISSGGSYQSIVLTRLNHFYIIYNGLIKNEFSIKASQPVTSFSILNDNNYGKQYILINNGGIIEAYTLNGVMLENFPIIDPDGGKFDSTPLTSDIDNDLVDDVVAATSNGSIYVFSGKTGKGISPFPISIGAGVKITPFIYRYTNPLSASPLSFQAVIVLDNDNIIHKWIIGTTNDQPHWGSEFGNSTNNAYVKVNQSQTAASEFFPADKAYNWPNPVYNGETNIRYYVAENSTVDIKIFDLAGELAAELTDNAVGGFDNETKWNVSNIQSGIYFAHLEVKGESGKTASKIIKIAVIK